MRGGEKGLEIKRVAYFRKSSETEDRQALSIPAQMEEVNKICRTENLTLEMSFTESHSAKQPDRPIFSDMLDYIAAGKANAIVTWAPNRLSRNSVDTGRVIHLMDLGKLLEVRTPSQIFRNNPNDKFLLSLFCSQAKLENDNKGEDVKRGLRAKVNQGWFPGKAPIGYINTPDREKGFKVIVTDPKRFDLVRKLWDMALSEQFSIKEIHAYAKDKLMLKSYKFKRNDHKPFSLSGVYRMLTDPFYCGEFEFPQGSENYYIGKHKAMVSMDEFERVQIRLGSKGRPRPQKKRFAYTGPIICGECGCQITAEEKHQMICSTCKYKFAYQGKTACPNCNTVYEAMLDPKILHYTYYHCTRQKVGVKCSQASIEVEELEKQLKWYLGRISLKKSYLDWAIKVLKEDNSFEAKTAAVVLKNTQDEHRKMSGQLERLLELRINNEISSDEFQNKRKELVAQKHRLQELIQNADQQQRERIDRCIDFFDFCGNVMQRFEEAKRSNNFVVLKGILMTLGSNLVLKDKKLFISLLKPFFILEQGYKDVPTAKATFEPEKGVENKEDILSFSDGFAEWLRVVEDIRNWYLSKSLQEISFIHKLNLISEET